MQVIISPPHLVMALIFDVLRQWSLYLNRCMTASAFESLDDPRCQVPFLLDPILYELEGGRYVGLIRQADPPNGSQIPCLQGQL